MAGEENWIGYNGIRMALAGTGTGSKRVMYAPVVVTRSDC